MADNEIQTSSEAEADEPLADADGRLKRKRGRPTKYSRALCKRLPSLFANGESVSEVCQLIGIKRRTFFDWVARHPEFAEAYSEGLSLSEAWWARLGRAGALGRQDINATLWIFNMKARFKWRDRPDDSGGSAELSPEEFAKRAHQTLQQLELADYGESGIGEDIAGADAGESPVVSFKAASGATSAR